MKIQLELPQHFRYYNSWFFFLCSSEGYGSWISAWIAQWFEHLTGCEGPRFDSRSSPKISPFLYYQTVIKCKLHVLILPSTVISFAKLSVMVPWYQREQLYQPLSFTWGSSINNISLLLRSCTVKGCQGSLLKFLLKLYKHHCL